MFSSPISILSCICVERKVGILYFSRYHSELWGYHNSDGKQCVWLSTHKSGKQCVCIYTLTFPAVCLLRAAPPSPFEHRISFCGYASFGRYLGQTKTSFGATSTYQCCTKGRKDSPRNGGDGRNGKMSTPQIIVATVASVALYSITSYLAVSTTI